MLLSRGCIIMFSVAGLPILTPLGSPVARDMCWVAMQQSRYLCNIIHTPPMYDALPSPTASEGVRAAYMRSVYPTKTFPNHYSIVTVSVAYYCTGLAGNSLKRRFYPGGIRTSSCLPTN